MTVCIDEIYTHHPLSPEQIEKCSAIRQASKELAHLINDSAPDSREKSLALSKLEEAAMWANAGVARN